MLYVAICYYMLYVCSFREHQLTQIENSKLGKHPLIGTAWSLYSSLSKPNNTDRTHIYTCSSPP